MPTSRPVKLRATRHEHVPDARSQECRGRLIYWVPKRGVAAERIKKLGGRACMPRSGGYIQIYVAVGYIDMVHKGHVKSDSK